MASFPEIEPHKNVIERPDEASPLNIEHREVATPVTSQFKAQVSDDQGQPLIQTPQTKRITIAIPVLNEEELKAGSKGNTESPKVWSMAFWYRAFLMAVHFGKGVLFSPKKEATTV